MEIPDTLEMQVSGIKYDGHGFFKRGDITTQVGDKDSPMYIHMQSDTDWATIAPGVVVALLVAWLTIGVQKTQIQGGISNFRHHWMTELREAASELIVTLRLLVNGCSKKEDFNTTDAYWEYSKTAMQMHSKLSLLLSRDDPFSDALRKNGGALVQRVMSTQYEDPEFSELLREIVRFQNALRSELEEAWDDAKSDLGFDRKFLLFRLFSKEVKKDRRTPYELSDSIDWDSQRSE
ncbi:hypothetical protein [Pseudomonas sp. PNPG3]|uniref:hypothetical protein n=1 Tax=Pseudomonas sp. PNPG3 TaxID=2919497 RepID=UPI001FFC509C|nr:hypothetical protein [Pseudomonas sp. PNPG3]MCK2123868.1 hypothetical protein [Pseudomonas sp. PNPG3]